jgi:hypothetical protein
MTSLAFTSLRNRLAWWYLVLLFVWLGNAPGILAQENRLPRIFPDYSGITLPPNIAPLNFRVDEPAKRYQLVIRSTQGKAIHLSGSSSSMQIPAQPWRALLEANAGKPLYFEISIQSTNGSLRRFWTITNSIAAEPVDNYLFYRLLKPLYNEYHQLGIYQRNLQNFEETPLLENTSIDRDCLNCHTFLNHQADSFAMHIRAQNNFRPMLLVQSNQVTTVNATMGYLSWHPSGKLLAFSENKLSLLYHTIGETRDVYDANSKLGIYWLDSNSIQTPAPITQKGQNDNWPNWSSDGRYLYYCSAPKMPADEQRNIRYDLCRIAFDLDRNHWGMPETLVAATNCHLSANEPRVSPDGKWLVFCLSDYGNFPVYQPSSDLYVMDLKTLQYHRLECNSDQSDSWHCWSSNNRWIMFSSKRIDGVFARPHFAYFDDQGHVGKAFPLPQKDPAFYESYLNTVNVPELACEPVKINPDALIRAVTQPTHLVTPKSEVLPQSSESYNTRSVQ